MTTYLFTNILGSFVLDQNLKIIDQTLFTSVEQYLEKSATEQKIQKAHPNTQPLPQDKLFQVLAIFKDQKYFTTFKNFNRLITKKAMQLSVSEDQLIIQTIANINEIDKNVNILSKRLREWYSLYFPELSQRTPDHQKYAELLIEKTKQQLADEIKLTEESMGTELSEIHLQQMKLLAQQILSFYTLRQQHEQYLETVMKQYCPNIQSLAGTTIAARLIELAKGLKHLALLPASTVQLLGAEKALFRHLKTGNRSPKHGVIINHPLVQNAKRTEKGRSARLLADKLSLCARLDYFKGEFKAEQYKKELIEKLKSK
ncbi:hypothetical protein A2642_00320 [Candidatus Nomurabacteria bacterium RIFCSPHIGHO2_01_FULL_39_10]|uniref:Nop domain-containing protein n=1 Tax=Candidatus Nomurabacteria bacterium RIFCSPHIGHO2_01_FULL_39_10 TaxID=1801733 RepID=A0A1F6V3G0_9BACT|nr:MAG: hypothetical protein A2642_00320 [Candidatus Nomurabacteria bacterium RIFCSPHIGHO2_01_FULL_39_10]